jgi:hypothetical protein
MWAENKLRARQRNDAHLRGPHNLRNHDPHRLSRTLPLLAIRKPDQSSTDMTLAGLIVHTLLTIVVKPHIAAHS